MSAARYTTHPGSSLSLSPRQLAVRSLVHRLGWWVELAVATILLFILSESLLPLLLHGGADLPDLSPPTLIERVTYWMVYLFAAWQIARRPRLLFEGLARNPGIALFVGIAVLSCLWSDDPGTSLRRAALLGTSTIVGLYLSSRFETDRLLTVVGAVLGFVALTSLFFGLFLPMYGVSHGINEGAWRGVFTQKNRLGNTMGLSALVFALLILRPRARRVVPLLFLGLSVALVLLSRSATSLLVLVALCTLLPAVVRVRRSGKGAYALILALFSVFVVVILALGERDIVLTALGKDLTLTGRTQLWAAVWEHVQQRPLLGHGYSAFWLRTTGPSEAVRAAIGWDAPHSHNGFLDLWLDLGVAGLAAFLGTLVFAVVRSLSMLRRDVGITTLWPLALLTVVVLNNVTESTIYQSHFVWALFVAAATAARPHAIRATDDSYTSRATTP